MNPDRFDRCERIARVGETIKVKPTKIDGFVEGKGGELFLLDIKTAKPNAGGLLSSLLI